MTAGSSHPRPSETPLSHRIVLNARHMPSYSYGHRSPIWWGTLSFAAAEGMGFVMVVGAYFYLVFINGNWPLSAPPPDLLWSSLFTVLMLASIWPNQMAKRDGEREDLSRSRRDLVIMSLIGLALLGIRVLELGTLHVRWDQNAYGSILWLLLGLHTLHLATDLGDTIVLTVLMFTRHGHGKRFSDVGDNAFYWYFVVASWPPIYVIIYWFPRWW
ncbi:cytochrome C oxidase subunit III [Microvirga vignae]|uniref:Cytochrome C oxidase subunit III n=1 Tax=Microvirga vignae TaxID=1225564 RepID=A0A0H1REK6_9HYPH|nr:cytochrome c oxidase subunit III [Microvirga vignae]KLK93630.1 cytochrome C oxidase subunit III [Microvirga vignae]